jgi:hypothetical protein
VDEEQRPALVVTHATPAQPAADLYQDFVAPAQRLLRFVLGETDEHRRHVVGAAAVVCCIDEAAHRHGEVVLVEER